VPVVIDHENSPSTLPAFSEYNAAEQHAEALANTLVAMNSQAQTQVPKSKEVQRIYDL
jgi:hypothetical protein